MIIGIDPSINCTGICVWDEENNTHTYHMIPSKMTKKMKDFRHSHLFLMPYEKIDTKNMEYSDKESAKFNNIYEIVQRVQVVVREKNPSRIVMEGVSYGSMGSAAIVDLCFLNSALRMMLKQNDIPFEIVSPTSLKKFACSNGQAEKDVIVDAWKRLDPRISNINNIKVDDLADSYFLAHYKNVS
jgi:Holliday junction resolvasome RuvABC endonuclease subunit